MGHIPSLEYRGPRHPVWVRFGQFLFGSSIVQFFLHIIDLVGRGESAMDIYAHLPRFLRFIEKPYFTVIVMIAGLAILWLQGKTFELTSSRSVLIHGITKEPFQLKYRMWPPFKQATWACAWALLIAGCVFVVCKTTLRNYLFVAPLSVYAKLPLPPFALSKTINNASRNHAMPIKFTTTQSHLSGSSLIQTHEPKESEALPQQEQSQEGAQTPITNAAVKEHTLSTGDRDRLSEAFYEFSKLLDEANAAWGQANGVRADENGPFTKSLDQRIKRLQVVRSAARQFETDFAKSRQKWNYYQEYIDRIFGSNPDNDAEILTNAASEYEQQLNSILMLKSENDAQFRVILAPEDRTYDAAILRFAVWRSGCASRLATERNGLR